jgi:hypothetical protein
LGVFSYFVSLIVSVLISNCFICSITRFIVLLRGKELISFSRLVLEAGFFTVWVKNMNLQEIFG